MRPSGLAGCRRQWMLTERRRHRLHRTMLMEQATSVQLQPEVLCLVCAPWVGAWFRQASMRSHPLPRPVPLAPAPASGGAERASASRSWPTCNYMLAWVSVRTWLPALKLGIGSRKAIFAPSGGGRAGRTAPDATAGSGRHSLGFVRDPRSSRLCKLRNTPQEACRSSWVRTRFGLRHAVPAVYFRLRQLV